jgi:transposase
MCGRFAHFGGVPMQILYDNTKIAVAPSSAGARSSETKARAADYLEMGFGPYGSLRRRGVCRRVRLKLQV